MSVKVVPPTFLSPLLRFTRILAASDNAIVNLNRTGRIKWWVFDGERAVIPEGSRVSHMMRFEKVRNAGRDREERGSWG